MPKRRLEAEPDERLAKRARHSPAEADRTAGPGAAPGGLGPAAILDLQRRAGNSVVSRLLGQTDERPPGRPEFFISRAGHRIVIDDTEPPPPIRIDAREPADRIEVRADARIIAAAGRDLPRIELQGPANIVLSVAAALPEIKPAQQFDIAVGQRPALPRMEIEQVKINSDALEVT